MAHRMIRVPWRVVQGNCGSPIGEASPMWSAVCSRSSTAAPHPGARMTSGGGSGSSRARMRAPSPSWPPAGRASRG